MGSARSAISRTCLAALTCAALVIAAEAPGRTQGEDFVPVTDAMLQDPDAADWLMWRRTLDGWGYSPLDSITRENVGDLRMVWSRALMPGTQEGTPLAYGCGSSSSTTQEASASGMQELLDASKAWWRGRRGRLADGRRCPVSVSLGVVPLVFARFVEVPVRIEVAAGP